MIRCVIPAVTLLPLISACAATPRPPLASSEPPAILHYLRSNTDGSEPEHIVHYLPGSGQVEVYKWVSKCTTAAYVTAQLDGDRREPVRLVAGKVAQDGSQAKIGTLELNPDNRRLAVRFDTPDGPVNLLSDPVERPWALFDYDLGDLNAVWRERAPQGEFAFWWTLIWPPAADAGGSPIRQLGWIDARQAGAATIAGYKVDHFALTLRSDPTITGDLWWSPEIRAIVAVRFAMPNHDNYEDFSLSLERAKRGERAQWHELLAGHYADCPSS